MAQGERLFVKVTRELLPQVKDKYPFLYLERGRLEIDDSSVKWVDADGNVVRSPGGDHQHAAAWPRDNCDS